jgi:hypothetical protein
MDLILSEEPSTDDDVLQLEPAEVEVDPLIDIQPERCSLCQIFLLFPIILNTLAFNIFLA